MVMRLINKLGVVFMVGLSMPYAFSSNSVLVGVDSTPTIRVSETKISEPNDSEIMSGVEVRSIPETYTPYTSGVTLNENDVHTRDIASLMGSQPVSQPVSSYSDAYGNFRQLKNGGVEFSLLKGLLKPQVIELLLHHQLIDSYDDIQWQTSDNFVWPNSHILKGPTLDHVLNDLLKPYMLVADFKGNGSVVVKNL